MKMATTLATPLLIISRRCRSRLLLYVCLVIIALADEHTHNAGSRSMATKQRHNTETSPPATNNTNETTCFDFVEWKDSQGDGCDWYMEVDDRCDLFGDVFYSTSEHVTENVTDDNSYSSFAGLTANRACCLCGGGLRLSGNSNATNNVTTTKSTTKSTTTTTTKSTTCVDDAVWRDIHGKSCMDYSSIMVDDDVKFLTGLTRCELFGNEILPDGTSANEKCCDCGGGFMEPFVPSSAPSTSNNLAVHSTPQPTYEGCVDVTGWYDSAGKTCEYYENPITGVSQQSWCLMGNQGLLNRGYVATTACCVCGGGLWIENMIFKEATDVPLRPMRPSLQMEGDPCLDRPGWGSRIGNIAVSCDTFSFRSTRELGKRSCDQYGHIESDFGSSATESCCICGGGYNGTLIGKTLRVTFPDSADVEYTLFTNETTGQKDGSIVQFMKDVASAAGFGMYEVKLSDVSRAEHVENSYRACMLDVELGVTDICIGPFWKQYEDTIFSNSMFADEFYLVVPRVEESTLELLMTPILPFTWDAWIWVALTCFYMGFGKCPSISSAILLAVMMYCPQDSFLSHNVPNFFLFVNVLPVINVVSRDSTKKMSCFARVNAVVYNSIKSCAAADGMYIFARSVIIVYE